MILFLADGRLGNQMFQYAFLNTLAKKNELIISTNMQDFTDAFEYDNKKFKQIVLNRYFNFLIKKVIKPYILPFLVRLKVIGYIKQNRNSTSSLPTLTTKKGLINITFIESNFFQSDIFFSDDYLDFTIKKNFINKAEEITSKIEKNYTKVFLHVRRGDYLFETYLGKRGIDLPKEYFLSAIESFKNEIANPYFIFLSDDPAYCEYTFKDIENKFISSNSMEVDLAIMTLCEYGVVSNSSFSWWGAYLMKDRKKVIFPKYWYGWKHKIESHIGIQPKWSIVKDVKYNGCRSFERKSQALFRSDE